jgi:hypothetical protein
MRLYEIATQVKIIDGDRPYVYWVTTTKPEKAKIAAIKKHRTMMGPGQEGELIATIVNHG